MRHAWLIIAHNEWGILQRLVSALDAPECDIYVHIDKKVAQLPMLQAGKARLKMLEKRLDVRWGSASQICCELALFEAAAQNGPYDFYHIISGTTLPLKPLSQINGFFEKAGGKSVLTGLCKDEPYQEALKMRRYNLFLREYKSSDQLRKRISQFMWKSGIAVQRILGIETNRGMDFYKASNWLSLTEEAVQYILSHKKDILRTYRYTLCGDEYFVPTELMASPLRDKVINSDVYLKREILRDTASVFSLTELPQLEASDYLFARKFQG